MVLRLFALLPRFLLCKASRGGAAERPRECSYPSHSKVSRPGSIKGALLQSVPQGHHDTNKGPGLVTPHGRGRELSTRGHVARRYNNESKMMINSNNPNTPPRGSTLLSLLCRKKEKKGQIWCSSPHTGPQGRSELPPELRRTPSRASPGRGGVRTRCRPPSRHDGMEADRGHR